MENETYGANVMSEIDTSHEWFEYFYKHHRDKYDYVSMHQYEATYSQGVINYKESCGFAGNNPVLITEFSDYDTLESIANNGLCFYKNNVSTVLRYINGGIGNRR